MDSAITLTDPVALTRTLIRAPSVTPDAANALDLYQSWLEQLGFACRRLPFGEVDNLYARLGAAEPVFCFAGHADVVPSGKEDDWTHPPFDPAEKDGAIWGRGAADMKGALGAMAAAVARRLENGPPAGSIAFLITGDEEGPAVNGTKKMLEALHAEGERFDHVLVGEPTNPHRMGEMIKSGRRGSINTVIKVIGRQGHVAYPERADSPIPPLLDLLDRLRGRKLDNGATNFQPSNLEITSIDIGNPATNVIPGEAEARFNIRFNINHTGEALKRWIEEEAHKVDLDFAGRIELDIRISGEAFLTPAGAFTALLQDAVEAETGMRPALSTGGGTSDARFIKNYAPVAEFGLVGATMHQTDERAAIADIECLTRIYERILSRYFDAPPHEAKGA